MADKYGSDFMTIVDEDGTEYELEVLSTLEYNGFTYLAVTMAGNEEETFQVDILCAVEDQEELDTVNALLMEQLYEEEDED